VRTAAAILSPQPCPAIWGPKPQATKYHYTKDENKLRKNITKLTGTSPSWSSGFS
jgi:hypothetical protein